MDTTTRRTLTMTPGSPEEGVPADVDTLPAGRSLQDQFLERLREERAPVSVFLVNGIRLVGTIQSFDAHTVQLEGAAERGGGAQMIYKHVIATVVPSGAGETSPRRTTTQSRGPRISTRGRGRDEAAT